MTLDLALPPHWLVLCALGACLLSGAGVLPIMVLAARRTARIAKRSAYERCARQLTFLAACLAVPLLVAGCGLAYASAGGWPVAAEAVPAGLRSLLFLLPLTPWLAGLLLVAGACLLALRFVDIRSSAVDVSASGAALCVWAFVLCLAAVLLRLADPLLPPPASPAAAELALALAAGPEAWPLITGLVLAGSLCLGLATAGGMALIVQILRRTRDDYGRDYYMLAARWCAVRAGWGGTGLWLLAAALAWLLWSTAAGQPFWIYAAVCAGAMLGASLCWLALGRSANPLRWKVLMLAGVLCLALFAAAAAALAAVWGLPVPG